MVNRFPGGVIRATPVIPTNLAASGVWTLQEALLNRAQNIWPTAGVAAIGGDVTVAGGYVIHTFKSNANFYVVGNSSLSIEYWIVGGGGGGAYSSGGGGGGRTTSGTVTTAVGTYAVVVGAGGAGGTSGVQGGATGSTSSWNSLSAVGGTGATNLTPFAGGAGGSGGGGYSSGATAGGAGGTNGGNGSNGNSSNGGAGQGTTTISSISGTSVTYAGGGGGGSQSGAGGAGGAGGGGAGGGGSSAGTSGTANTGGGGGSGGGLGANGGSGGSGIVILRYLAPPTYINATGGTLQSGDFVNIRKFTASSTYQITSGEGAIEYLCVAGGGGAGNGGGGAGGFKTDAFFRAAGSYTVTIGSGGTAGSISSVGGNGGNSVFDTVTSTGGGGGGYWIGGVGTNGVAGSAGGSGGGGAGKVGGSGAAGGAASPAGQGNAGGSGFTDGATYSNGGGGGGAGAAGSNVSGTTAGNGGVGLASTITGASVTYAGGGAGATNNGTSGTGGSGGGGNGTTSGTGVAGTANTGGGGGGSGNGTGGAGGSGIVIAKSIRGDYGGNDDYTKLLLHFDGTNGATSTTDSSASGKTVTFNGSGISLSTSNFKFGSACLSSAGTAGAYVSIPSSTDFNFSSAFTVDFYLYCTNLTGNAYFCGRTTSAGWGWGLRRIGSGLQLIASSGTSSYDIANAVAILTLSATTLYHIEFSWDGATYRVFVDGVLRWSSANTAAVTTATGQVLVIGAMMNATSAGSVDGPMNGTIDEFRVTAGLARHTSDFADRLPPTAYS